MSDMFRKMQLIEAGELERLQQRQVKDYDPIIKAMVHEQNEVEEILSNKKLSDEDKLALLSNAQQRFKKLKASIGPISSTDAAVPIPLPIVQPPPPSQDTLMRFLDKYPSVIRSNAAGELVFRNQAIPGSSYNQLLEGGDTTQPGFHQFIQGLKILHAPRDVLMSEAALDAYDAAPSTSSLKSAPASDDDKPATDAEDDKPLATTPKKARRGRARKQKGKGKAAPPPGTRPRILYLYH